jgi:polyferredoxin
MMEAVNQEKNLIRFVSENGIKAGTPFQWTLRVKAYSAVLLGLLIVFGALLITRKDFETNIIRQRGSTYSIDNKGIVSNIFEVDILNKTQEDYQISLKSTDPQVEIEVVGGHIFLESEAETKERIVVKVPNSLLKDGVKKLKIEVYGNGEKVDEVKTKFIGPLL